MGLFSWCDITIFITLVMLRNVLCIAGTLQISFNLTHNYRSDVFLYKSIIITDITDNIAASLSALNESLLLGWLDAKLSFCSLCK